MNFTPQQQHSLLSKMGYSGPVDSRMMEQFIQSNPGAAAKMGKFDRAMKRGFRTGGLAAPLWGGDPSNRPYMAPIRPAITPAVTEPTTSSTPVTQTPTPATIEEAQAKVDTSKEAFDAAQAKLGQWAAYTTHPGYAIVKKEFDEAKRNYEVAQDQYTSVKSPEQQWTQKEYSPFTGSIEEAKQQFSETQKNLVNKQRFLDSVTPTVTKEDDGTFKVEGFVQSFSSAEEAQKFIEENSPNYSNALKDLKAAQKAYTEQEQNLALARQTQQQTMMSAPEVSQKAIKDPSSLVTKADTVAIQETPGQIMAEGTGVVAGEAPKAAVSTVKRTAKAAAPTITPAATMEAATVTPDVTEAVSGLEAAKGEVGKVIEAAQQTTSAVSELEAAQGQSILMDNPVQREIQEGELISGSVVDAQKVEQMNAQLQAAQATPSEKATVQGQLEGLMQDFEGGETPAWAAGAMRNAQAMLAQRGLGASSMAGQAVIQAAMESALPIAQADANTRAQFESQNLSNRQQVAMFAAQQRAAFLQIEFDQEFQSRVQNAARIADIANMNFTAEQQIALENSRIANTMNLQNLSNRQAMVIAEASALSNLELSNLNNRQQAAVQNAQNFLQMDLTNLNNEQQTAIFKTQQRVNALLSDQAAENAALQFNAASKNQTNQFFADLQSTISRFNADQTNAVNQFNAGQENAAEQFNASLQEQRDQFNANNKLIVAQANAKWRQDIATLDTAAENEALMEAAKTANSLTTTAMDEIWQRERDLMNFSFQAAENAQDRYTELLIADKKFETEQILQAQELSAADKAGKGAIFGSIAGELVGGLVGSIF